MQAAKNLFSVLNKLQLAGFWKKIRFAIPVCMYSETGAVSEAAGGLSAEDRKKYAEQVTMQFWQAIGGNSDEFDGLSSDSD